MTDDGALISIRDAKNRLSEVVDRVEREHERVVITRHGKPAVVMLSADDLASLEETLDVLSRPTLVTQITASLEDLANDKAEILSRDEVLNPLNS